MLMIMELEIPCMRALSPHVEVEICFFHASHPELPTQEALVYIAHRIRNRPGGFARAQTETDAGEES